MFRDSLIIFLLVLCGWPLLFHFGVNAIVRYITTHDWSNLYKKVFGETDE